MTEIERNPYRNHYSSDDDTKYFEAWNDIAPIEMMEEKPEASED